MTYKILTDDTKKVIFRSHIQLMSEDPNMRLPNPEDSHLLNNTPVNLSNTLGTSMVVDPNDLIGRTYLKNISDDGDQIRMKIVDSIDRKTRSDRNDPNVKT